MNRFELASLVYRGVVRPLFFLTNEERIHNGAVRMGEILGEFWLGRVLVKKLFGFESEVLRQEVMGIKFDSPVGLSAGFDKDGRLVEVLESLSFGFGQVGSVTLGAYEGNEPPRVKRLPKSKGIIVNYGLKSEGGGAVLERLKRKRGVSVPISISVAKTNSPDMVGEEAGLKDYVGCLKKFVEADVGDFYTINISCPNAFGGQPFCEPSRLGKLLGRLGELNITKPLLVKMPIDLPWLEFKEVLEVVLKNEVAGVVIGNVAKDRSGLVIKEEGVSEIKGGISGLPIKERVDDLISKTYGYCGGRLVIIGVGGVFNAEDVYEKIRRGASLVQLITGMIYEGPSLPAIINAGLVRLLKADGYKSVTEAVGAYHR